MNFTLENTPVMCRHAGETCVGDVFSIGSTAYMRCRLPDGKAYNEDEMKLFAVDLKTGESRFLYLNTLVTDVVGIAAFVRKPKSVS